MALDFRIGTSRHPSRWRHAGRRTGLAAILGIENRTPEVTGQGYRGCVVMPIDDPVTGAVRRGPTGAPVVLRRFTAARFTGACSYAEGTTTGYLVPIAFLDQPRVFRIFKSGQLAP